MEYRFEVISREDSDEPRLYNASDAADAAETYAEEYSDDSGDGPIDFDCIEVKDLSTGKVKKFSTSHEYYCSYFAYELEPK